MSDPAKRRRGNPGVSPTGERRQGVEINLAPSALEKGRRIAVLEDKGSLSSLIERLILAQPEPPSAVIV